MRRTFVFLLLVLLSGMLLPHTASTEISFGEEVIVKLGQTVKEAVTFGDDIHVYGTVKKAAVAIGGDVLVESGGCVNGDAVSIGGDIHIKKNAEVKKNAVALGGRTYKDSGGLVHGEIITLIPASIDLPFDTSAENVIVNIIKFIILGPIIGVFGLIGAILVFIFSLFKLVLFLAFAVLITHFFPENVSCMAEFAHKEFWKCFFLGFLAIIVIPFLIIALIFTIVGIPVIPPFLIFLFITHIYGSVSLALLVGRLMPNSDRRSNMLNVIIGVLLIGVVKLIPAIGFFVKFAVLAVSFGVVIITRFGTQKYIST